MADVATLVPVEEYLRRSRKPYCEYREGVLTAKTQPTLFHSLVSSMLVLLLRRTGLEAAQEVTVCVSAEEYLIPDVVAAPVLTNPYPTEPVLLCCEVLSAGDRLGAPFSKCEDYHKWGVPYCWVVDPVKRTAWEYHRATGEPVRVAEALHAGDFVVALPELFSAIESK